MLLNGLLIIPPFLRVPFILYVFRRGSIDASALLEEASVSVELNHAIFSSIIIP